MRLGNHTHIQRDWMGKQLSHCLQYQAYFSWCRISHSVTYQDPQTEHNKHVLTSNLKHCVLGFEEPTVQYVKYIYIIYIIYYILAYSLVPLERIGNPVLRKVTRYTFERNCEGVLLWCSTRVVISVLHVTVDLFEEFVKNFYAFEERVWLRLHFSLTYMLWAELSSSVKDTS